MRKIEGRRMSAHKKQMSIGMNLIDLGAHTEAWRIGETAADAYFDPEFYRQLARVSEKGKLDAIFLADIPACVGDIGKSPVGRLDPFITMTLIAEATQHIGLIATASSTYNNPYNLARRVASLDIISRGRAAWNVVTTVTDAAAQNFNLAEITLRNQRYERAYEFIEVAKALWDSWETGAIIGDREAGVFGDASKLHSIDYQGKFFNVKGPLNVPRTPQGRPVIVQAGSSEEGKRLGAKHADVIFTSQTTLDSALNFYKEMKNKAKVFGRNPDQLKIMPGLATVIGGTEYEAKTRYEDLQQYVDEKRQVAQVAARIGLPVEELSINKQIPWHLVETKPEHQTGSQGFLDAYLELAKEKKLTVRELAQQILVGHRLFIGTPEQIADTMQDWFERGAVDGFNIIPERLLSGTIDFVEQVVPILQSRGLFRKEYTGTTLRDHLGLAVPKNRYTQILEKESA